MRDAVRARYVEFTTPLEGCVSSVYIDSKGYCTVGIGNLIDPVHLALGLPFVHEDGTPATRREIADEWAFLRNHQELAQQGWRAAARLERPWPGGPLHLTPEGIKQLVTSKLDENDRTLRKRFPGWEQWPADAQLLVHSLAWACGPEFRFPNFEAACKRRNWNARDEYGIPHHHIDETNAPGIIPRNAAQVILGQNAEEVVSMGADYERLYYPGRVTQPTGAA